MAGWPTATWTPLSEVNNNQPFKPRQGLVASDLNKVMLNTEYVKNVLDSVDSDLKTKTSKLDATTTKNSARIANLEARLSEDAFIETEYDEQRTLVPANAAPYAKILKIGGMSQRIKPVAGSYELKHSKVMSVTSTGKNLIDVSQALNSQFVANRDGTYTMTKNGSNRFSARIPLYLPAGTTVYYSATIVASSGIAQSQKGLQIQMLPADAWTPDCTINTNSSATPQFDVGRMSFYLDSEDADGAYITVKDIQLEIGPVKTEHEPYVGALDT